jgi:hypothetical protein
MSEHVSEIPFPDDRRVGLNVEFDISNTWYSRRQMSALNPIENAVPITN